MARRSQGETARSRYWRGHIEAWSRSGKTVRGYCRAQGLAESAFHWWKRELARRETLCGPPEPAGGSARSLATCFTEVPRVSVAASEPSAVEVVLSGGRLLRVGPDFDEGMLRRLVIVLESLPC